MRLAGCQTNRFAVRNSSPPLLNRLRTRFPAKEPLAASAFVQFLGFDPGADDLWLADLAAHGQPRFQEAVAGMIGVDEEGAPRLDLEAFTLGAGAERLFTDKLAEAFGWRGVRVERSADLLPALKSAFEAEASTLIVVPIDYRENAKLTERLGNIALPI